jgi:hypothetical protein
VETLANVPKQEEHKLTRTPIPKVGVSLGSVRVYSLTLSCTPRSMRHDSRASSLARNLATPCLGHEPKARVTIKTEKKLVQRLNTELLQGQMKLCAKVVAATRQQPAVA